MEPGTRLGHYEILAPLGAGGMGEVYRARDSSLDRDVAIKVLAEDFATDLARLARFEREAKLLASLNHPNIATIHGFDESDGVRFIAMELVEGQSLDEQIEASGRIELDEALQIARRIALALEAAHQAGVIHRDLKPANVQVAPDGTVKVLDFGLAKAYEADGSESSSDLSQSPTMMAATGTGVIMGTAPYMSPEQARGRPIDKRSDIWSFGGVLYEMLGGTRAFVGDTAGDTMAAILKEEPDWVAVPAATPWRMVDLLRRCLTKEPRDRLHDIADARIEIDQTIADPDGGNALAAGAGEAVQPSWRRYIPTPVALGLGVAIIAVTALLAWTLATEARQPPAPPMHLEVRLADEDIYQSFGAPVLSPDGKRIAYVVGSSVQRSELYIRRLDQPEGTRLVSDNAFRPFFSPDGQWVGFFTGSELKKVPVTGGTPQTVCSTGSFGASASWGLDDTIIFGGSSGLFRVAASGDEPEMLIRVNEERRFYGWPQVLPASKAVLFTSALQDLDAANIEVLDLETKERRVVQRGGFHGRYVSTGHLVYVTQGGLFAVPFDPVELEVTGSAVSVVQGADDLALDFGFSFSDTGTLAYASASVDRGYPVVWVDRQGNTTPLWEEPGLYGQPRLSPDGTRLALNALRGNNTDVWIYDIQRSVPTRLTFDEAVDSDPVWSPDGQFVAFNSFRGGRANIYRTRADGSGEIEQLLESPTSLVPYSWSQDGRLLTYGEIRPDTGWDILVLLLEGNRESQVVVDTEAIDGWSAFSPNGRWLAYDSYESGINEVYVQPYPPAPGRWQVSSNGGGQARWSADGRELFYRSDTGIMVVAVETEGDSFTYSRGEQLFEGSFLGGPDGMNIDISSFTDYDVTDDGQRFVMFPDPGAGEQQDNGHVTLVTNWFDELKRLVPTDP